MTGHGLQRATQVAEMSETVEERVEHVVIDCQFGSVTVVPSADALTRIDAEVKCDGDDPLPTISWTVEAGTLRLDVQAPERNGRAYVRLVVSAPRTANVEATSQFGSIEVRERTATVELRTGAGSVRALNIDGDVTLRSQAGTVVANDVRGESILLETQAGSIVAERIDVEFARVAGQVGRVKASFVKPPQLIEASTTVGKLEIAVPSGLYQAKLSGRVRVGSGIDVSSAADFEHRLDIGVTVGSARIVASDA